MIVWSFVSSPVRFVLVAVLCGMSDVPCYSNKDHPALYCCVVSVPPECVTHCCFVYGTVRNDNDNDIDIDNDID